MCNDTIQWTNIIAANYFGAILHVCYYAVLILSFDINM